MESTSSSVARGATSIVLQTRVAGAAAPSAELALPAGFLARYELVRTLGVGAMGMVVEAQERATGKTVAVKFMRHFENPDQLARFLREGRLLGEIRHPNVMRPADRVRLRRAARAHRGARRAGALRGAAGAPSQRPSGARFRSGSSGVATAADSRRRPIGFSAPRLGEPLPERGSHVGPVVDRRSDPELDHPIAQHLTLEHTVNRMQACRRLDRCLARLEQGQPVSLAAVREALPPLPATGSAPAPSAKPSSSAPAATALEEARRLLSRDASPADLEKACEVLDRSVAAAPDKLTLIHSALAHGLCGRLEKRIALLERAIAVDPRSASAHFQLALAYDASTDPRAGRKAFEHAKAAIRVSSGDESKAYKKRLQDVLKNSQQAAACASWLTRIIDKVSANALEDAEIDRIAATARATMADDEDKK